MGCAQINMDLAPSRLEREKETDNERERGIEREKGKERKRERKIAAMNAAEGGAHDKLPSYNPQKRLGGSVSVSGALLRRG